MLAGATLAKMRPSAYSQRALRDARRRMEHPWRPSKKPSRNARRRIIDSIVMTDALSVTGDRFGLSLDLGDRFIVEGTFQTRQCTLLMPIQSTPGPARSCDSPPKSWHLMP